MRDKLNYKFRKLSFFKLFFLFETNTFFRFIYSFDELKIHKVCWRITNRIWKQMLSKSRQGASKVALIFAT